MVLVFSETEDLSVDIGVPACLVDIFGCEKWKLYLVYRVRSIFGEAWVCTWVGWSSIRVLKDLASMCSYL